VSWETEQTDAGLVSFEAWFGAITLAMLQDGNHYIDIHVGREDAIPPGGGAVLACADIPAA
jgi:hypothetical protein